MTYKALIAALTKAGIQGTPDGEGMRYHAKDIGCHESSGQNAPSVTVMPLQNGEKVGVGCFGCQDSRKVWSRMMVVANPFNSTATTERPRYFGCPQCRRMLRVDPLLHGTDGVCFDCKFKARLDDKSYRSYR